LSVSSKHVESFGFDRWPPDFALRGFAGQATSSVSGMNHLVLIDGHHLMYRAYWAIPRTLKTKAGEQSNAVFGVMSMLMSILTKEQPTHLLFCFDEGEDTFRHQEAVTYKEGRAETPDDFYVQIPRIIQGIEAFGIKHISDKRYEADDYLCVYAREAKKAGMQVTIVTGDRDAFQIADEGIRIAIPHKGYQAAEYLGPVEIFAKYGIRPDQVPAYKGLCGDASDNLRGVTGIGPKTAAELLQKYENLAGIYEHIEEIRPALRAKLERDRESAFFCERMATLLSDIDLPAPLDTLALTKLPVDQAIGFLQMMEFTLLERRFRAILGEDYGKQIFVPSTLADVVTAAKKDEQMAMF
jgi:DNA polymerase-1